MRALHIRRPGAAAPSVGMADLIAGHFALLAEFTKLPHRLSHSFSGKRKFQAGTLYHVFFRFASGKRQIYDMVRFGAFETDYFLI